MRSRTAVVPEPAAAEVVLSGIGFDIVDTAGDRIFTHRWPDDVAAAVDALEDALGSAPAESYRAGDGTHIADAILYSWDGLVLSDAQDLSKPRDEYAWPSTLTIDVPELNGVSLRSVGGTVVGDSAGDVRARAVAEYEQFDGGLGLVVDLTDPDAGETGTTSVLAATDPSRSSVVSLFASSPYPGM